MLTPAHALLAVALLIAPTGPAGAGPASPDFPAVPEWKVYPSPESRGPERDLYRALAGLLSELDAPPDRAASFALLNDPRFRLVGWYGHVESATSTPTGTRFCVRVHPQVTSTIGASTTVFDDVLERYEVRDGVPRFLDSSYRRIGYVND